MQSGRSLRGSENERSGNLLMIGEPMSVDELIERHLASGRRFTAVGVQSFAIDAGDGEPVLLMHGVPSSSYLYRKVIPELAARGLRGVAFDLPGLGLAERPPDFDYSWTGLGRFASAAVDELDLERFHLVVHDVGGPVGWELIAAMPQRVRSLTILNTLLNVESFKRPWVMEPFAHRGVGELWLAAMRPWMFVPLMHYFGIEDRSALTRDELKAYVTLLKREDRGRAFLKIMRGFERTAAKERIYVDAVRSADFPIRIVWGAKDPAIPLAEANRISATLDGTPVHELSGRHFFQEDCAAQIAEQIAENAHSANAPQETITDVQH